MLINSLGHEWGSGIRVCEKFPTVRRPHFGYAAGMRPLPLSARGHPSAGFTTRIASVARMAFRAAITWLAVLACSLPARATPTSVHIEELTWTELRDAQREGFTTVIVPIGGTEQNGPHMALGKHNARVRVLAGRIASELGNAVVAPVLAYVPESAGHQRFPGTIDVPGEAFAALLAGAARSFRGQGFRDVVLIGDSGDYQGLLQALAARLNAEWKGQAARTHYIGTYYREAMAEYRAALGARGLSEQEIGVHAGVADTALLMATAPALVRTDQFDAARRGSPANGVTGNPQAATAALGQIGADLIVRRTVAKIRTAVTEQR